MLEVNPPAPSCPPIFDDVQVHLPRREYEAPVGTAGPEPGLGPLPPLRLLLYTYHLHLHGTIQPSSMP